jgi:hypothetical protein
VLGKGKQQRQLEEFRASLRGRLNAALYDADSEHEQYTEASFELLGELLGAAESARGASPLPQRVAGWLEATIRNIKGWQDAPVADVSVKGALLAGCEEWSDLDGGRLQALVDEACSTAAHERPRVDEDRDSWTVLGLTSWDPDRTEGEGASLPGFESLAAFVRGQAGFRRLASIQEEHAVLSHMRVVDQHFGGVDPVPAEQLPDFRRSQRRAWNLGVTLGLWDALELLPSAPK